MNKPKIAIVTSTRPELLENNSMIVCSDTKNLDCALNIAIQENTKNHYRHKYDQIFMHPDYDKHVSNNVIKLLMRYDNVQK